MSFIFSMKLDVLLIDQATRFTKDITLENYKTGPAVGQEKCPPPPHHLLLPGFLEVFLGMGDRRTMGSGASKAGETERERDRVMGPVDPSSVMIWTGSRNR